MSAKNDPELGKRVHEHLVGLGLETPMKPDNSPMSIYDRKDLIEKNVEQIMSMLQLDLEDDSLVKTPHRVAKMYAHEIFYGLDYKNFPRCMDIANKIKYDELICQKNILVRSVCEHHFVPFIGTATVGYLPDANVSGLSKFNRIVDFFSRRPQVQERLTAQICHALSLILKTEDVAVVIEAEHYCIKLRGVEDPHSSTVTSKMLGKFRTVPELRNEFLSLTR